MAVGWAYIGRNPGSWKNVFCETATSPAGDIAGKKRYGRDMAVGWAYIGGNPGSWKNVFCETATSPAGDIAGRKEIWQRYGWDTTEIWFVGTRTMVVVGTRTMVVARTRTMVVVRTRTMVYRTRTMVCWSGQRMAMLAGMGIVVAWLVFG
jgi:hypothetical protein